MDNNNITIWIENLDLIKQNFTNFAKFGDIKSLGKCMSSKNFDKWMKESKVIDGKIIKSTDTDIAFTKIIGKKLKGTGPIKMIDFSDLENVFQEIANHIVKELQKKKKNMTLDEQMSEKDQIFKNITLKISECKTPHVQNREIMNRDVVSRLTDSSKFTGTHKERFDEAGKGKGLDGRREKCSNNGYVQGSKIKQEILKMLIMAFQ
ncbi:tubulin polymerization-promoting protein family member 2-like isoform X2 [Gordionus sp. m RMFG-2023]|uniref:tubulin polymerization-promoting protein family member 2-like isoform X2 n=1 Tax=Gordionus sp. m RMFG-2023 TaxID=3053472 RepID=UPI0031FCBFF9